MLAGDAKGAWTVESLDVDLEIMQGYVVGGCLSKKACGGMWSSASASRGSGDASMAVEEWLVQT